ncbi:MAG TPA: hypothetical protein VF765_15450 [Polyangiaceae bacterium]
MNAPSLQIPDPADGDSFVVKHALEVARSLWDCGEHRQAVVWVRRAAEAAGDGGDASRLATLARAAVDLGAPATSPPPSSRSAPPPLPKSTVPPRLPSRALPKPRLMPVPPPAPAPAPVVAAPAAAPAPSPAPLKSFERTPTPIEVRRRVSVKVSVRDPDLIVVRPLADGENAPAGTREAFLVMVDR